MMVIRGTGKMGEAGNRGQREMLLEYRKEGLTQTKPAVEEKTGDGDQAGKKQKRLLCDTEPDWASRPDQTGTRRGYQVSS